MRLCHQSQMQQHFTSCVHTIKQVSGTKHTRRVLIFLQWPKWDGCICTVGYCHGCFLCHLSRKFARLSPHVVVRRGASANTAAAGNLATTVVTLMTTRNKFMWVHLLVYMINSCFLPTFKSLCSVPLGFTKCIPDVGVQWWDMWI